MKIKTSNLTGRALDWAVTTCEDITDLGQPEGRSFALEFAIMHLDDLDLQFSTNWAQGGPIIEREQIATQFWRSEGEWEAHIKGGFFASRGPTALVAAMRCYVASKLGDEVEVPDELA